MGVALIAVAIVLIIMIVGLILHVFLSLHDNKWLGLMVPLALIINVLPGIVEGITHTVIDGSTFSETLLLFGITFGGTLVIPLIVLLGIYFICRKKVNKRLKKKLEENPPILEETTYHQVSLDISTEVVNERWEDIFKVFSTMDHWVHDGDDYGWRGDKINLTVSVESSGLKISGDMPEKIWTYWITQLKYKLSKTLGYDVRDL